MLLPAISFLVARLVTMRVILATSIDVVGCSRYPLAHGSAIAFDVALLATSIALSGLLAIISSGLPFIALLPGAGAVPIGIVSGIE